MAVQNMAVVFNHTMDDCVDNFILFHQYGGYSSHSNEEVWNNSISCLPFNLWQNIALDVTNGFIYTSAFCQSVSLHNALFYCIKQSISNASNRWLIIFFTVQRLQLQVVMLHTFTLPLSFLSFNAYAIIFSESTNGLRLICLLTCFRKHPT